MVCKSLLWALALTATTAAAQAAGDDIVPKDVAEAALAKVECDTANEAAPERGYTMDGELEALDLAGALKLVPLVCWRAAYNSGFIFIAVDPAAPNDARLLEFDHPTGGKMRKRAHPGQFRLRPGGQDPRRIQQGQGARRLRRHRPMDLGRERLRAQGLLAERRLRRRGVRHRRSVADLPQAGLASTAPAPPVALPSPR